MYFISFSGRNMGLTNQLFALSKGINDAIKNNCNVVVIDQFLCDYNNDKYIPITNVLDLDKMNVFFKKKYNLILTDKYNFDFELLNVKYGIEDKQLDITETIKKKYYHNKKLFINKNTIFNNICGDPCFGVKKYVWVKYKLNNYIITDKYNENRNVLTKDIDYTNENYIKSNMGWPSKSYDTFEDILTHLTYHKQFYHISNIQLSEVILTNKVNLIHLRIEKDAIKHWSKMNKMTEQDFKIKVENKYIELIQTYINKNDTTIILSSSFDNKVINFLDKNKYNHFTSKKNFKYRELNAVVDFIISKQCNNIFIGNFNFNGMNGSSFSYYIKKNLHSDIIYKYIDLDHI